MAERTIGVVGGGIVGLAVARELTERHPGTRVVVLEKEDRLGAHQTASNSGVVHAGIYYAPGSLKAELCTRGRLLLREYCRERGLPYDECGKLVVAIDPAELPRLDALEANARANGVPGLRRVAGRDLTDVEPHAAGLVALHSPATAITDFPTVAAAFGADVERAGGEVRLATTVTGVRRGVGAVEVATDRGPHRFDRLVVCAGLHADRVSRLADGVDGPRIVPFRGEYLAVSAAKRDLVRGMVYPVPDPRFPFLGVHFTRRVSGYLEVGPNAVLGLRREGYRRRDVSLADVRSMVTWPGFWRMARQHWRTGVGEVRGSLSTRAYLAAASRYVPEIGPADVVRSRAGVRAQAVDRDGSMVDDFRIEGADGITTVRNAPSPAATSSLAIAQHVVDRMGL
ncbi:L-2-hydroxyglutarate oxidase [Nocardioides dongkuii]|uniref:L-2-hydroxyglutarate oxidase n=1 Tax=Nocardioides dongkuii TaxID=2760089 RepID=UPI0015FA2289|nr:L-2-hydroxyglutarate oxidase [Nocardioides dongkuii]